MKTVRRALPLLLSAAAVAVAQHLPQTETRAETGESGPPPALKYVTDRERPVRVTVTQEGKTASYSRDAQSGLYGVPGYDERLPFDQNALERLFCSCARLMKLKTVEEDAADLSVYGLSSPARTVSAAFENGDVLRVEVGARSPLEDGYYGRLSDSGDVLLLSSYDVDSFLGDLRAFREKRIFYTAPGDAETLAAATRALVFRRGELGPLEIRRGQTEGPAGTLSPLLLVEPVAMEVDEYAFTNTLARGFMGLLHASLALVEDHPQELSAYGLDAPDRLCWTGEDGGVTLLVGGEDERGVYLMQEGIPCVYQVRAGALKFFSTDYTAVMSKIFWIHNIEQVERLKIAYSTETHTLSIDNQTPGFTLDGNTVGETEARSLFLACISPMIAGGVPADAERGDRALALEMVYRDGRRFALEFYALNERHYSVWRDGTPTGFYCTKKGVSDVVDALQTLQ